MRKAKIATKKKPIKVFYSALSGRFYASNQYKITPDGIFVTGEEFDVTDDIGAAVTKHKLTFEQVP